MRIHLNLKPPVFLAFTFSLLFLGCGQTKTAKYDREALQREMESREIKRISDAEIIKAAYQQGALIADTAQQILFSALHQQLQQNDSLATALKLYQEGIHEVKDSLAPSYAATIRRISLKTVNQENSPDTLEKLLLDSYFYNIEKKLPLEDNVQEIDDYYFLYTKPIMISNQKCLRCHGEVGKEVSLQDYETLKKHYPNDEAFDYNLGDFRGMWSIKLSKKELIRNL